MNQADIEWLYGPGFRIIATKHGDFAIPPGIKPDLGRALIEHDSFAHHWMCHEGIAANCPDGCDGSHGDGARTALYKRIERVTSDDEWRAGNRETTHDDIM